ncbi:coproporphyrinogen oxidase [Cyclospora cayetanensis]|uniref:coproporphyrinogen oxidase n=1 Tax=Cyclospora cayetanensis TaxID=88456 RepID=A0A1D3D860_9EIME|nr:coproporphyrinogen oxidase [Cyclospora cayetanensis]
MCVRGRRNLLEGVLEDEDLAEHPAAAGEETAESPFTFFAAGLSLVIHPDNPMAPTSHANFRMFQLFRSGKSILWWFGGGVDLSPAYVIEEDCVAFHAALKAVCDRFDVAYYPRFKVWCDYYFRLAHRREARGVGGIFFDDLNEGMTRMHDIKAFCCEALNAFAPLYLPIVEKRCQSPFTEAERRWQLLRRGRYVEFNLVYDRGTKFGFSLPGSRSDSILVSLPLLARWEYGAEPEPGSREAESLELFRKAKDWVAFDRMHLDGFEVPLEPDRAPEN